MWVLLYQYLYCPSCSSYISYGTDEENLFSNCDHFLFSCGFMLMEQCYCKEKLNIGHCEGSKG